MVDRGQVRLRWGDTPVYLFFATASIGRLRNGSVVGFGATRIPVLDRGDLAVLKAIFGRPQDWVDIEGMIRSGAFEIEEPHARLRALVGENHAVYRRLASMERADADETEAYRREFGSPGDPGRGPRVDHCPEPAD